MEEEALLRGSAIRLFDPREFPVRVIQHIGRHERSVFLPEYHTECEIQFIWQGHGDYYIRGNNYHFAENSVLIVHKDEVHCFIPDPDSYIKKSVLMFAPRMFKNDVIWKDFNADMESHYRIVLSEHEAITARVLLDIITAECREHRNHWTETTTAGVELLLVLLQRASRQEISATRKNPMVDQLIKYLEANFAERVVLEEIANDYSLSPSAISKAFKAHTGLGFKDYLIHRRVVEARKLLENTDLKILTIAHTVGFDDVSTFNRDFRILTGFTPSEYRRFCTQQSGFP